MKPLVYFAVIVILCCSVSVTAAERTNLVIGPRSTMVLNGSSNVADWRCTGTTFDGEMEVAAPIAKVNEVIDRIEDGNIGPWMSNPSAGRFPQPSFELMIRIDTLRCSGGRPMERDLTRALKADRAPAIVFRFGGLRSTITHDIDQQHFEASIGGQLSLAGATRDISFPVVARRITPSRFQLTAQIPVRMTDFDVAPPTAFFGVVKAADDLTVTLDLTMETAR